MVASASSDNIDNIVVRHYSKGIFVIGLKIIRPVGYNYGSYSKISSWVAYNMTCFNTEHSYIPVFLKLNYNKTGT